jgi:hypothetical protein
LQENKTHSMKLVTRYAILGALLGLLVGVSEGISLYRTPRPVVLLSRDTSYVIFFLAPLLDAAVGGVLGSLAGLLAASRFVRVRWLTRLLSTPFAPVLVLRACGALAIVAMGLWGTDPPYHLMVRAATIFLIALGILLIDREKRLPLKPLGLALAALVGLMLAGVGIYALRPSSQASVPTGGPRGPKGKPNIVLVVLDTVRADHLSLYGYHRPTTSHLDGWAKRGVVLENAIAPAPWTLASHASMFTGLLPRQHGADWAVPLDGSPWTLAEVLKSEGYETVAFNANFGYGLKGWGYDRGFGVYADNIPSIRHNLVRTYLGRNLLDRFYKQLLRYEPIERRNAEEVNNDIFSWLRHRPARPFFLFINYFDAHDPYLPPAPYDEKFGRIATPLLKKTRKLCYAQPGEQVPAQDVRTIISAYDNSLAYLHQSLDDLLQQLQHSRVLDNTIVIITSDHGEGLGDHQRFGHASGIYREVLHVPLLFFGPGIPQGLRLQHIAGTRELFPTVLDLVSPGQAPFHRRSLSRFWRPAFQPDDSDGFVVSELAYYSGLNSIPTSISLFTPQWRCRPQLHGVVARQLPGCRAAQLLTGGARLEEPSRSLDLRGDHLQNQARRSH